MHILSYYIILYIVVGTFESVFDFNTKRHWHLLTPAYSPLNDPQWTWPGPLPVNSRALSKDLWKPQLLKVMIRGTLWDSCNQGV